MNGPVPGYLARLAAERTPWHQRDDSRDGRFRVTRTAIIYVAAALAEIGGCFAFWAWMRGSVSMPWLVPGIALLIAFAWLLALAPTDAAGRAFAAYGGIYIVASLGWLWLVEGVAPDRYDVAGTACCLVGAGIILGRPGAT